MSPRYLITAASGHIGTRLVPLLLSLPSKPELILPTTNSERLKSQLQDYVQDPRVHIISGDIQNSNFAEEIIKTHRVTAAFVCLVGENELMVTLNLFDAIRQTGTVKHVVYVSAGGDYGLDAIRAGSLRNNSTGHVLVKYIIEAKLQYGSLPREAEGGFSWTILGPTLFYDNDLRSKQSMLDSGLFDEPLGPKGVSRVDCADIALAAANALEDDGKHWSGKKIMLGSLETYTADDVARLWSAALGKKITSLGSDLNGLESIQNKFTGFLSTVWGRDVRLMYDWFAKDGFKITDAEYQDQVKLLGRAPSSYEEFVKATGTEWTKGEKSV